MLNNGVDSGTISAKYDINKYYPKRIGYDRWMNEYHEWKALKEKVASSAKDTTDFSTPASVLM